MSYNAVLPDFASLILPSHHVENSYINTHFVFGRSNFRPLETQFRYIGVVYIAK